MNITLHINGIDHEIEAPPHTSLLSALRGLGFHGVKFGDEHGLSGSDTVLLDGKPVNAGSLLAAQAEGHKIATIEALGEHPEQGWKHTEDCIPCRKPLWSPVPSSADTALLRRSSLHMPCLRKIPTRAKRKCGKLSPVCFAAAQAI